MLWLPWDNGNAPTAQFSKSNAASVLKAGTKGVTVGKEAVDDPNRFGKSNQFFAKMQQRAEEAKAALKAKPAAAPAGAPPSKRVKA